MRQRHGSAGPVKPKKRQYTGKRKRLSNDSTQCGQIAATAKEQLLFHGLVRKCADYGESVTRYMDRIMSTILNIKCDTIPLWTLVQASRHRHGQDVVSTSGSSDPSEKAGADKDLPAVDFDFETARSRGTTGAVDGDRRIDVSSEQVEKLSFASFLPSGRYIDDFVQRELVSEFVVHHNALAYFLILPSRDPSSIDGKASVPRPKHRPPRGPFHIFPVYFPAHESRAKIKSQSRYCMAFGRGIHIAGRALAQLNFFVTAHRWKLLARLQHLAKMIEMAGKSDEYRAKMRVNESVKSDDESSDQDKKKKKKRHKKRKETKSCKKKPRRNSSDDESESESESESDGESESEGGNEKEKRVKLDEKKPIGHPTILYRQSADQQYATANTLRGHSYLFDYPIVLKTPRTVDDYIDPLPCWYTPPSKHSNDPVIEQGQPTMPRFTGWTTIQCAAF